MNRRNFLNGILVAGASFMVLPGAGRLWRASRVIESPSYSFPARELGGEWMVVWLTHSGAFGSLTLPKVTDPLLTYDLRTSHPLHR